MNNICALLLSDDTMMKEIIIVSKDRVGLIADISYILANEKINIEQIDVNVTEDKAIIRLGVLSAKYEKAKSALERSGFEVLPPKSLVVKLEDKPGSLAELSKKLAEAKINILNIHVIGKNNTDVFDSIIVDKPKQAKKVLGNIIVSDAE